MKVSVPYFQKDFFNASYKEAYLDACKWISKNVVSKAEISDSLWNMKKIGTPDSPAIKLELYFTFDEGEMREGMCERCQSFHKSFFVNEEYNCNTCKLQAYEKQAKEKIAIKEQYRKERLDYIIKE